MIPLCQTLKIPFSGNKDLALLLAIKHSLKNCQKFSEAIPFVKYLMQQNNKDKRQQYVSVHLPATIFLIRIINTISIKMNLC